ncbi:hypothetical protein C7271_00755 [filamentous cyanobacterium CCP5]|nr:hypothetical protein C7271_00755 [filamentous cyanobacterium CCP5]
MGNQEFDFEAIRTKLQRQQSPQARKAASAAWIDWEASPGIAPGKRASLSQLNGTVAALQQRSVAHRENSPRHDYRDEALNQRHQRLSQNLQLHRERLSQKAQEINNLSVQQERAMLEMKDVAERWQRELKACIDSADISPAVAESLMGEFLFDCESAVLAWADSRADDIVLTYRSADLDQATREANQLAHTLRQQSVANFGPGSDRWLDEWQTFWAEPVNGLREAWTWLHSSLQQWWQAAAGQSSRRPYRRPSAPSFTLIDGVIWLGSGIFSRIILDFVLSLYPGLWSVAVAIVTAMTAYALYRATLAPKLDFSLAYRVLLAIGGLIIGGRF